MGKITENSNYEQEIYLIETTDPVQGGVNGVSNKQAHQLANRTAYLKADVDAKALQISAMQTQINNLTQKLEALGGANLNEMQALLNKTFTLASQAVPVGAILGVSCRYDKSPKGWIYCAGQEVSRVEYKNLYEKINRDYGAGDGDKTFNVPDYRGKFLRGFKEGLTLEAYQTQQDAIRNITGSFEGNIVSSVLGRDGVTNPDLGNHNHGALYGKNTNMSYRYGYIQGVYHGGSINFDASKALGADHIADEIRPINQAVYYYIKY